MYFDAKEFGKRLHDVRTSRGITQEELAVRLGLASKQHVSRMENGERSCSIDLLIELSCILHVSTDYLCWASYLVPFLSQEEITDISVLNPVSTHIKLIERNNVLREVVSNVIICAKLTVDRFFRCQQIGDLNIQLFAALVAYKINFLIARSADSHFIAPAQQFQIHDILQNEIDVTHIAAKD